MFIIGIAGASGSGKTYLAQELHRRLSSNDSNILAVDSYYKAQDHLTLDARAKQNYDHPDSLELDLLAQHLEELIAGNPIQVPVYDYSLHTRSGDYFELSPTKYLIVEGILTFHKPSVRELIDLGIFVETPPQTCFARRLQRDVAERGRTESCITKQWQETVLPMYEKFCAPGKGESELIYFGDKETSTQIDAILERILNK